MPADRLYTIDEAGHVSGPPAVADLGDDEAAMRLAAELAYKFNIEVWEGSRLVGTQRLKGPAIQRGAERVHLAPAPRRAKLGGAEGPASNSR